VTGEAFIIRIGSADDNSGVSTLAGCVDVTEVVPIMGDDGSTLARGKHHHRFVGDSAIGIACLEGG
jgi:hypothetical protein